jgi:hypothetical protein
VDNAEVPRFRLWNGTSWNDRDVGTKGISVERTKECTIFEVFLDPGSIEFVFFLD